MVDRKNEYFIVKLIQTSLRSVSKNNLYLILNYFRILFRVFNETQTQEFKTNEVIF